MQSYEINAVDLIIVQQNRLREYRSQVAELRNELKSHQDQAQRMKVKQMEWNEELQAKNSELREQKKTWLAEANALRSANADLKVRGNSLSSNILT